MKTIITSLLSACLMLLASQAHAQYVPTPKAHTMKITTLTYDENQDGMILTVPVGPACNNGDTGNTIFIPRYTYPTSSLASRRNVFALLVLARADNSTITISAARPTATGRCTIFIGHGTGNLTIAP